MERSDDTSSHNSKRIPSDLNPPQITVLIENPHKNTNWGPLLRCCTAFGITQIFVVGYDKCSVEGSHGAYKHVELLAFHNRESAVTTLKDELGFTIVGVLQGATETYRYSSNEGLDVHCVLYPRPEEKMVLVKQGKAPSSDSGTGFVDKSPTRSLPQSFPLHSRPFSRRTCLAVGKRARGLPLSLAEVCDVFVHIPHFGLSPSLDNDLLSSSSFHHESTWLTVEAGMSIVLHEFASWAGYGGAKVNGSNQSDSGNKVVIYQGQKYQVEQKHKGQSGPDEREKKQEQRRARREQNTALEEEFIGDVFGSLVSTTDGDPFRNEDAGDY